MSLIQVFSITQLYARGGTTQTNLPKFPESFQIDQQPLFSLYLDSE
jgi:hypothetical protein